MATRESLLSHLKFAPCCQSESCDNLNCMPERVDDQGGSRKVIVRGSDDDESVCLDESAKSMVDDVPFVASTKREIFVGRAES